MNEVEKFLKEWNPAVVLASVLVMAAAMLGSTLIMTAALRHTTETFAASLEYNQAGNERTIAASTAALTDALKSNQAVIERVTKNSTAALTDALKSNKSENAKQTMVSLGQGKALAIGTQGPGMGNYYIIIDSEKLGLATQVIGWSPP